MKKPNSLKKKIGVLAISAALVIVTAIFSAFTKAKFPKPTGPFSAGTLGLEVSDSARSGRTLLLQIYYPARQAHDEVVSYHPHPEVLEEDLSNLYGIPQSLIKKISRATVAVKLAAKPSDNESGFPLLIFSHGYNGSRFQNSFLLPELASHGYVVVSIEHTGSAAGTLLSSGTLAGVTPFDSIMHNEPFSDAEVVEWSKDQIFVLNSLDHAFNQHPLLKNLRVDFSRVGVFGHSFGGATAANTLTLDKRFLAGINLDGFYFGKGYLTGFDQPFMELRADNKPADKMSQKDLAEWKMSREQYHDFLFVEWNKRITGFARQGHVSYVLRGANHMSFSDFSLMFPFGFITAPARSEHHALTQWLVLNFFDEHLKNQPQRPVSEKLSSYLVSR